MSNKVYPITARFKKSFFRGTLANTSVYESMGFCSVKEAEQWYHSINQSTVLDYVIQDFEVDNPANTKTA